MANVYFDGRFVERVRQLTVERDEETGNSVFPNLFSLMIFAAMVGRHYKDSCNNVKVESRINEIADRVFIGNNLDGIAYLLALDATKDGEILREGNENELWKYLENFALLGMQEIDLWLQEEPYMKAHDVILHNMKIEAAKAISDGSEAETIHPVF